MPVRYIPYTPITVEGQAVLNNIARTRRFLQYRDSDGVYNRLQRGMPLYETELLEEVGTPAQPSNLLLRGDCLSACAYLKDKGIAVDLVYIARPLPPVPIMPRRCTCGATLKLPKP